MAERTGRNSPATDESEAVLSLAGIRPLASSSASPTTGAAALYTMTMPNAKRLLVTHMGCASPAAGDIRFRCGATATAAYPPLYPQRYVVFELGYAETISFFNTGADTVVVYCVELP